MAIIQVEKIMREDPAHGRFPHEPKYEAGCAFLSGEYSGMSEARVPIIDMGFMHADAAYDVVTVSKGSFFRLDQHLSRMEASCRKFKLENPYGRDEVKTILSELVRRSGLSDAYVWWCVTRGSLLGGDRSNPDSFHNSMYAFAIPYLFIADDEKRNRGIDLHISRNYIRIPTEAVDPTAKNFHWMDMKLSLFEAREHGRDWSVLTDSNGFLTEAPGSNIFLIKNGELFTPDNGCLEGITRQSVLDLASALGIKTSLKRIPKQDLIEADEAFTSTSAGGISPINSVDGNVLGGRPGYGPLTERLHNLYWEKRWGGWHATPVEYGEK